MCQCEWQRFNSLNKETFYGIKFDTFYNNHLQYTETFGHKKKQKTIQK